MYVFANCRRNYSEDEQSRVGSDDVCCGVRSHSAGPSSVDACVGAGKCGITWDRMGMKMMLIFFVGMMKELQQLDIL